MRIGGDRADMSQPWSAVFIATVSGRRRAFSVAEIGAFDWFTTFVDHPDEITRREYAGGELLVASRRDPLGYRAVWRGQWFELHTRTSGPVPAGNGIRQMFDSLRLTDTPEGMHVTPRNARTVTLEPPRITKRIPRIGRLAIERPDQTRMVIPDFRGLRTPHGEMWHQELGPESAGRARRQALILATATAVTRLVAGPRDTPRAEEAIGFLEGLNVTWEPA